MGWLRTRSLKVERRAPATNHRHARIIEWLHPVLTSPRSEEPGNRVYQEPSENGPVPPLQRSAVQQGTRSMLCLVGDKVVRAAWIKTSGFNGSHQVPGAGTFFAFCHDSPTHILPLTSRTARDWCVQHHSAARPAPGTTVHIPRGGGTETFLSPPRLINCTVLYLYLYYLATCTSSRNHLALRVSSPLIILSYHGIYHLSFRQGHVNDRRRKQQLIFPYPQSFMLSYRAFLSTVLDNVNMSDHSWSRDPRSPSPPPTETLTTTFSLLA